MALRALPPAADAPGGARSTKVTPSADAEGVRSRAPRRLAPGAPESPGPLPFALARALRADEAVVWWNEKAAISWRAVLYTLALGLLGLAAVTAFAPEFWAQPWRELWMPALVPLLPALLVYARERASLCAVVVTDGSILGRGARGEIDGLAIRNIRRVTRDLLTGGILLEGARHRVRIPPTLLEDARAALASQLRDRLRGAQEAPHDPLGWLP